MPERKATTRVEVAGADKAAGELGKVQKAQDGVAKQTTQAAPVTEDLTEAQQKLNASKEDYIGVLTRINPLLGGFVDAGIKSVRILADLANKQIRLNDVSKLLRGTLGGLSKSIKLLGAVGVATTGLTLLYKAIEKVRKEAQRAAAALAAMLAARTALEQQAMREAKGVAEARAEKPFRKPFTFEQVESVRETLDAAAADVREKLKPILEAVGGAKGFGPAPGAFTGGQVEALARTGWQAPTDAPIEDATQLARYWLDRFAENARMLDEAQHKEREAMRQRAVQEALERPQGGGNLRTLIEQEAGRLGITSEEGIDRLVKMIATQIRENIAPMYYDQFGRPVEQYSPTWGGVTRKGRAIRVGGQTAHGLEVPASMNVLTELKTAMERMVQTNEDIARALGSSPSVGYQVNIGTDAAAMKRKSTNGQNHRSTIE